MFIPLSIWSHCWCCSVVKSSLTICNSMDCSTPGFPVLHYLLEFAQNVCALLWLLATCGSWGFPDASAGKESACSAGDLGSIHGLGRSPGEGKGYPLQYNGQENSMNCIAHGVAKSRTRLSGFRFTSLPGLTWQAVGQFIANLLSSQGAGVWLNWSAPLPFCFRFPSCVLLPASFFLLLRCWLRFSLIS